MAEQFVNVNRLANISEWLSNSSEAMFFAWWCRSQIPVECNEMEKELPLMMENIYPNEVACQFDDDKYDQ